MDLPQQIGARVRLQMSDDRGWTYLCWRGFFPESSDGRHYLMRRDLPDSVFGLRYPAPAAPRFPIEMVDRP